MTLVVRVTNKKNNFGLWTQRSWEAASRSSGLFFLFHLSISLHPLHPLHLSVAFPLSPHHWAAIYSCPGFLALCLCFSSLCQNMNYTISHYHCLVFDRIRSCKLLSHRCIFYYNILSTFQAATTTEKWCLMMFHGLQRTNPSVLTAGFSCLWSTFVGLSEMSEQLLHWSSLKYSSVKISDVIQWPFF